MSLGREDISYPVLWIKCALAVVKPAQKNKLRKKWYNLFR